MKTRHAFIGAVLVLGIIAALIANARDTRITAQDRSHNSGSILRQLTKPAPVVVEQINEQINSVTTSQPG